ncbi:MAG: DUF2752 domain-containing protein [Pyrinomonadaceae bacterium]
MEIKAEKHSNIERIMAAAGIIAAAIGSFVVAYFNPVTAGFFPQCPLFQLFGINCPGCGLTRGFHALFHGDILTALHYNALLPLYAFILGYILVSVFLIAVRGRGLSWKVFTPNALYALLILMLVFAVLRNIPVYPLNLFAP